MLDIKEYPVKLERLVNQHIGDFLDAGSKDILINKARTLKSTIKKRNGSWRFSIEDKPLTFIKNDHELKIDVTCKLEGVGNTIQKQNIQLRIWCLDDGICYRDGLDHPDLKGKIERNGNKRVILRFHFDQKGAEVIKLEPPYHLQIGGITRSDDENCWFPEGIDVPRFPFPPMDIILLCEFILMNFFQEEYREIRKKPEWKSLVRGSQDFFQKSYFEECLKCFNQGDDTLLGALVTHAGGL